MDRISTTRSAGQAAPEFVGIIAVVAMLLGAVAMVMSTWRPPQHPPRILDGVSQPLHSTRPVADTPVSQPVTGGRPLDGDAPWFRRYPSAFGRGAFDRGKLRVGQVVHDPLGTVKASVVALNPLRMIRDGVSARERLGRRFDEYGRMDRDDAVEAMLYDLGGLTFDTGLRRVGIKAARAGVRSTGRRARRGDGSVINDEHPER